MTCATPSGGMGVCEITGGQYQAECRAADTKVHSVPGIQSGM